MIFNRANSHTALYAAVRPVLGTSAGLGLRTGMAQNPTQGCAGQTGIARAEGDSLPGGAVYK